MAEPQKNFDLKEEIRAYWSARAETFDQSASHFIEDRYGKPEWQKFLRQAAGLGSHDGMDGLRALDLACGTGEMSRMLCSLGADVTGLDFSEAMLAKAQSKLKDQKWMAILSDAENLKGVKADSFDFAVTRHLAWTLTDPKAAFAEWSRVLKPGGRLLINDGNWSLPFSRSYWIKRKISNWLQPEIPRSENDKRLDTAIRSRLPYSGGLFEERLIEDLCNAGFELVQRLDPSALYQKGMLAVPFAQRLRQTSENRFSLVFSK